MHRPNPRVGGHPKGLAEGDVAGFQINHEINRIVNLIVQQITFSTNRLPAVENGGRNGIHHRRLYNNHKQPLEQ